MKIIKAQKIGIKARDYLYKQPTGKVHSVFTKAINLITSENTLLTILYTDDHPHSISLNHHDFPAKITKQNEDFRYENQMLFFNKFQIALQNTPVYNQKRSLSLPSSSTYIKDNLTLINDYLCRNTIINQDTSSAFINILNSQAHIILKHIDSKNFSNLSSVIQPVIGYGPGLTPAGDDFISGLFCTLYLYSTDLQNIIPQPEEINDYNTVFFAKKQLLYSARGYSLDRIHRIIKLIPRVTVKPDLIKQVLEIGATSGYAWLKGILLAFEILLKLN